MKTTEFYEVRAVWDGLLLSSNKFQVNEEFEAWEMFDSVTHMHTLDPLGFEGVTVQLINCGVVIAEHNFA